MILDLAMLLEDLGFSIGTCFVFDVHSSEYGAVMTDSELSGSDLGGSLVD